MVTRRAGWSRGAQEAYGRRARAARWSRRRGGRAHRRPEPRAVCRSCRWAPSSLGQRRADAWQPREGRRRGTPAPSFRHTLVWDSGGFSSNGVREAQRILKTIDTEDIPGGWGDNNGIVCHRHIHDPGIQQEPDLIVAALAETRGCVSNPSGAAARLGMPPSTLDSKLKALQINRSRT